MPSVTVTAETEVEVDLEEFSTEELVAELKFRRVYEESEDLFEVLNLLQNKRVEDATVLLERIVYQKWRSEHDCEAAWKKAMENNGTKA